MLKTRIYLYLAIAALVFLFAAPAGAAEGQQSGSCFITRDCTNAPKENPASTKDQKDKDTYSQETVISEVTGYFGKGAEGMAKVVEKAFKDHGRPNGYIKGEEASGAFIVGLRYGDGTLTLKNKGTYKVNWQGPSIGFDVGGDASKVFVLVYNLQKEDDIYQRFPAVDGSLYFIAGTSLNYHQSDNIILAPIRLGVGLRFGINVGYMHYTRSMSWNPL
ncbi:MAG TPA: DUF1134 domain-containing protein [Burkholderiales bacterium]|nr:DUF1134 domain-containing protein [Burkholderiales bacterium]